MSGAPHAALTAVKIWDVLPNAACLCDAEGLILRYNRGAAELWGREPRLAHPDERYCGSHRLYWPDGSPLAHRDTPMADALQTGRSCRNTEVVIERPSGHRLHAHVNVDPIRDEAGQIVGAINCLLDITSLKEAENKLRDSERTLREVLNALPSAVYTTDADGHITFFNQAAVELSGHTPELGTDRWCVSWKLYRPDGAPLPHDECPMAVALREKRPVRGQEAVAERPNGTRVPFIPYPTPLFDRDGNLTGAVNMLVEIADRKQAEESAGRLAAIVEFSDDAIVSKNTSGIIQTWNAGAERLFGYAAHEVIGKPINVLIPPDRQDEEPGILRRISRGERIDHYETVRIRKDGTAVDISLTVSPLKSADGRIVGASKIARDISERRGAERRRQLLVNELNHRVKNTLATVQSIATQTFRADADGARLAQFEGRLVALARTHDVLTRESWEGADLEEVVAGAIAPVCVRPEERFKFSGPPLRLRPKMALSLSIAIHELCTNAAKYGALSNEAGRIRIEWALTGTGPERQLQLRWEETAGPPVDVPGRRGFGTRMLERALARELGAQATLQFQPSGVIYEIEAPWS
ncbi:MAG: PAS domain S-box protein [Xanthobacteraceae bacterium]|nr:PAS domain S-box protein [Xanthobacteraceae bacterium]